MCWLLCILYATFYNLQNSVNFPPQNAGNGILALRSLYYEISLSGTTWKVLLEFVLVRKLRLPLKFT